MCNSLLICMPLDYAQTSPLGVSHTPSGNPYGFSLHVLKHFLIFPEESMFWRRKNSSECANAPRRRIVIRRVGCICAFWAVFTRQKGRKKSSVLVTERQTCYHNKFVDGCESLNLRIRFLIYCGFVCEEFNIFCC